MYEQYRPVLKRVADIDVSEACCKRRFHKYGRHFYSGTASLACSAETSAGGPSSAVRDEEPAQQSTEQHKGIHSKWISLTVYHFLLAIVIALLRPEASAGGDHHRSPGSQDYHTIW